MHGPIRVMTERVMTRGFEPTVTRIMEQMQSIVKKQPGLISVETWGDVKDHHNHVTLSQWRSQQAYKAWETSAEYQKLKASLVEVLDVPQEKTRIFQSPKDEMFLL
ncbi:Aste57867_14830 [Aphanomyces stellatus]|uniref:Aste57867_14830 protein n=1 Tax=Aphanomyces stellatus TaxID=120398 RepID=A0A485L291_9STRA|nr:hypothetical protein As57867_014774 [Aphanomyces stellatus]VFT91648.1 Aste57867_14830 [Aphanomyces stellatus]